MSVPSTEPAPATGPADTAPTTTEPAAAAPSDAPTGSTGTGDTPPWGDPANFDAEKAWNLIQGLREDKTKLSQRPALSDEDKAKIAAYDQQVEASKTELERLQEREQKLADRATKAETRAVKSEIARLADGFADPSDAMDSLDPSKYLTDDGEPDVEGIKAALADLLERKPHWGKAVEQPAPSMRPNPAQGRTGQPAPTREQQIDTAQAAGDMRTVMRLKAAQAAEATTT